MTLIAYKSPATGSMYNCANYSAQIPDTVSCMLHDVTIKSDGIRHDTVCNVPSEDQESVLRKRDNIKTYALALDVLPTIMLGPVVENESTDYIYDGCCQLVTSCRKLHALFGAVMSCEQKLGLCSQPKL